MKQTGLLLGLFAALMLQADVKLPAVFSDHMVLQRSNVAPVWGWAEPGEKVTVQFAGQTKSTTAGKDGKWMVRLDAIKDVTVKGQLSVKEKNTLIFAFQPIKMEVDINLILSIYRTTKSRSS